MLGTNKYMIMIDDIITCWDRSIASKTASAGWFCFLSVVSKVMSNSAPF